MKKTLLFLTLGVSLLRANPLLPPHDPRLLEIASPVEVICSPETKADVERLLAYAQEIREKEGGLLGLAGPQVGIQKRIIAVDTFIDKELREAGPLKVYINPEILWYSSEVEEGREGCFSVDLRVAGIVSRSQKIYIRAFSPEGLLIEEEFSGLTARIFQHEVDHLNGICFPVRVGPGGALHFIEEDQYDSYRKNWQNWPHKFTWDQWLAMKAGKPYV